MTAAWGLPFAAGPVEMFCEGYIDFAGTDNDGEDINAQPCLLAEIMHGQTGRLMIGVEWYYHRNSHFETSIPEWSNGTGDSRHLLTIPA